jgi:hypothetical protein
MYPLFSGGWAKNDQLRVLGKFREQLKRAAIQWGCMNTSSRQVYQRRRDVKDDVKMAWVHP